MSKPLAIVAGAGAGLGQSILKRFDQGGFTVVGLGRTAPPSPIGEFHSIDLADADKAATTLAAIIDTHGCLLYTSPSPRD